MTKVIGVIPAAGLGSRVPNLPCSKEIFPVGFQINAAGDLAPKPVGTYMVEQMLTAGAERIFIVIRKGKWDIPNCLGNGLEYGTHFTYLLQERLAGLPYALDLVHPWLRDEITVFGMPDTILSPEDALRQVAEVYRRDGADVVLGLFPTETPQKFGMVEFDDSGHFIATIDKPAKSSLRYMWGIGCWGPAFSEFMHGYLLTRTESGAEIVFSEVLQAAHKRGLSIHVVPFPEGEYIDIGSPSDLRSAIQRMSIRA